MTTSNRFFWSFFRGLLFLTILSILLFFPVLAPASPLQAATLKTVTLTLSGPVDACLAWNTGSVWSFSAAPTVLRAGHLDSGNQRMASGLRFTAINIPYGSTISSAYLQFTASAANNGTVVNSVISVEDSPNPPPFSTFQDFTGRQEHPRKVSWSNIPAWASGGVYNSPDISPLVQASVSDTGWLSGGSIVLFWGDMAGESTKSAGVCRQAVKAVKLVIAYDGSTAPVSGTIKPEVVVDPRIEDLRTAVGCLSTQVADLKRSVDATKNKVDSLPQSGLKVDMTQTTTALNSVAAQLTTLQGSVATLNKDWTPKMDALVKRLGVEDKGSPIGLLVTLMGLQVVVVSLLLLVIRRLSRL